LVLRVDIRRGLRNLRCGASQWKDKKASKKIDTQKRNDQLLSLGPEKSRPEITHPKVNLVSFCTQIYIRLWIGRATRKWYLWQG
jgi:hypothetical protein